MRISQRATEMEITVRLGYAASIGNLHVGLNQARKWPRGGVWLGAVDGGHLTGSKWPTFGVA